MLFAAVITWVYLSVFRSWGPAWLAVVPAALFLWAGSRMARCELEQTSLKRAMRLYERGLARLADRWAGTGPTGEQLVPADHLYARDLDICGDASLFQLLCAARTGIGQQMLARWLLGPAASDIVGARQVAVAELTPALDFREELAVLGDEVSSKVHPEALIEWGERPPSPGQAVPVFVVWFLSILGAFTIVALLTYLSVQMTQLQTVQLSPTTVSWLRAAFLLMLLVNGMVLWIFRRRTQRVIAESESAARDLDLLASLLRRIEAESFDAPRLKGLRAQLDANGQSPSRCIAHLDKLMAFSDSRDNVFVRMFGLFVLWDLHLALGLERWRIASGKSLRHWLATVAELEALASFARHHFEHPGDVFPHVSDGPTMFTGAELGHPLIAEVEVVRNSVNLGVDAPLQGRDHSQSAQVLLVSGSNMSGKSTLLRTVGMNAVLAQAGAPVRARGLSLSPVSVGASIRLRDSLHEGTSRFYAEIVRLRAIVEKTEGERPVLFLIDELLHGTNSHDRRIGALAIVRGLCDRGAVGLVTTHDLALTETAGSLGARAVNVHFEDHLEDGQMRFDYRMRPGVVRKSNAIELMRSIGLEV